MIYKKKLYKIYKKLLKPSTVFVFNSFRSSSDIFISKGIVDDYLLCAIMGRNSEIKICKEEDLLKTIIKYKVEIL